LNICISCNNPVEENITKCSKCGMVYCNRCSLLFTHCCMCNGEISSRKNDLDTRFGSKFFNMVLLVFFLLVLSGKNAFCLERNKYYYDVEVLHTYSATSFMLNIDGEDIYFYLSDAFAPEYRDNIRFHHDVEQCGVSKNEMRSMGLIAESYTKKLLNGKRLSVQLLKIKGNKAIGRLYLVDEIPPDLNDILLLHGYACTYPRNWRDTRGGFWKRWYKKRVTEARQNKSGLWQIYPDLMECLCDTDW